MLALDAEVAETSLRAGVGEVLRQAVEEEGVGCVGWGAGSCRVGAEVALGERHAEGGIGREVEGDVAFAPVSVRVVLVLNQERDRAIMLGTLLWEQASIDWGHT